MRSARPFLPLLVLAGCGRPPVSPAPLAPTATRCQVLTADSAADTLTVGVTEPVDVSHAPVPVTEAERFVFATFYEPLVRLDCQGRVIPALADHWGSQDDPRRWTFTLREDAHFWDGTPVTADDVLASWTERSITFAESLTTADPRIVTVVLARADSAVLRRLADPRLAVSKPGLNGAPPMGTTTYGIAAWTADRIVARPLDRPRPVVTFRLAAGADPRDLLDQGVDLLMTDDPEALRYAGGGDAFEVLPLPWAWTYVFVGASRVWPDDSAAQRDLAGGAVRGDVRVAEPLVWWSAAPRCPGAGSGAHYPTPGAASTIAYPSTDPVARDIAARLVALGASVRLRALGLGPNEFATTLAANHAGGFVTVLPRQSYTPCLELPAGIVVPLLDARSSIIARPGRVSLELEWDGTPRLVPR